MRNYKRVLFMLAAAIVVLAAAAVVLPVAAQGLLSNAAAAQPVSTSGAEMVQAGDTLPPICYSRMDYYYACRNGWKPKA